MVQILVTDMGSVKGKAVGIGDSVINIYGLKRGGPVVPGERFPGQLLSSGQPGQWAGNHILHGHEPVKYIGFAGSVGSVNCQNRKRGSFMIRMNQAGCQRGVFGSGEADHCMIPDRTVILKGELNKHRQIPPSCL